MIILYLADIRFPLERANGIQTMETCFALADRGHTVHLVVRPDTESPARDPFQYYGLPSHDRLIVERAPVMGPAIPDAARRLGYLSFAAGRAIGLARTDIIMTRDLAVASLLLRIPRRPPLVYESHGYAPDVASALPGMLSTAHPPSRSKLARLARREARVWRRADGYVTITAGLRAELTERFGTRERIAVVHDGARLTRSSKGSLASGTKPPHLTVAYAGHVYPWKGVDTLLQAIAQVPGVRGLVVGGHDREPDLARLRTLTATLGIAARVTFTGHVAPSEVAAHLADADILALPNPASAISTRATSPLKLFEYMAARKAIVASDLPSIREVLAHDVSAVLVDPGNPAALAAGIRRLADDAGLRERLAAAAYEAVAEYSWTRRAERLEALFDDVIASRGARVFST